MNYLGRYENIETYDFDEMCDCKGPGSLLCWLLIKACDSFEFSCISEKETLYDQQIFKYDTNHFAYRTVYGFSHFIDSWVVYEWDLTMHIDGMDIKAHGFTNGTAIEFSSERPINHIKLRPILKSVEDGTHHFYMEQIVV